MRQSATEALRQYTEKLAEKKKSRALKGLEIGGGVAGLGLSGGLARRGYLRGKDARELFNILRFERSLNDVDLNSIRTNLERTRQRLKATRSVFRPGAKGTKASARAMRQDLERLNSELQHTLKLRKLIAGWNTPRKVRALSRSAKRNFLGAALSAPVGGYLLYKGLKD